MKKNLEVYLFNVGAGDHIMIVFPDGSLGIIDSFYSGGHELNLQEAPAITYLKSLRQEKIDNNDTTPIVIAFLCVSHADTDHLRGLTTLFDFIEKKTNNVILENLWLFGGIDSSQFKAEYHKLKEAFLENLSAESLQKLRKSVSKYDRRLEAILEFKSRWKLEDNSPIYLNDIKEIDIYKLDQRSSLFKAHSLGPVADVEVEYSHSNFGELIKTFFERVEDLALKNATDLNKDYKGKINRNNISSILGIYWEGFNIIFGGDATKETWEVSLKHLYKRNKTHLLSPDFIKVSHHGADGSTTPLMWDKLLQNSRKKIFAGISAGKRHSHPHVSFSDHITECCKRKEIELNILRTNICSLCPQKMQVKELKWFTEFHGASISDPRVKMSFDSFETKKRIKDTTHKKNLVAYVFEFPQGGLGKDIKVYKGVSSKIGMYRECVFGEEKDCYCSKR